MVWMPIAVAQVAINGFVDYEKRIKSAELVAPLRDDLFGDSVNLQSGSTEFQATDVSLQGNNSLPVQLGRRFKVQVQFTAALTSGGFSSDIVPLGGFGAWDIDVPYLYGMFDAAYEWRVGYNADTARCSGAFAPRVTSPLGLNDIWSGNYLHIPGQGDQELLLLTTANVRPADGLSYRWGTRGNHRIRCGGTIDNYPGESFIVVDTLGTTYQFGHAIKRHGGVIEKSGLAVARTQVFLMVTRVEDRHGNYVNYRYTGDRLDSIESSDGRRIDLQWSGANVVRVTADGREWNYTYGSDMTVELPDHSKWTYASSGALAVTPAPPLDDGGTCAESQPAMATPFAMDITSPSGARGTFKFAYMRHGRSGIPSNACTVDSVDPWGEGGSTVHRSLKIPYYSYTYSLYEKEITGPGLAPLKWTYEWEDPETPMASFAGAYCTSCDTDMVTFVRRPDGTATEHIFGALWGLNEGRLLGVRTRDAANNLIRSDMYEYISEADVAAGVPFPPLLGEGTSSDNQSSQLNRPLRETIVTQDGTEFRNRTEIYDEFARPKRARKFNALYSRTEDVQYHHNLQKWVIGQTSKLTDVGTGKEVSRTEFDPVSALPLRTYSYGKLQQTLTYNTDGTIATVADGRNLTTTLSNWKRGIPQSIRFPATPEAPAGATKSAVVSNNGTIESITDENGAKTCYTYDVAGRLARITYPSESNPAVCKTPDGIADTAAWNPTNLTFEQVQGVEYGLPAAHWKQTVATGNARRITYLDALWRPVVEETYDAANPSGTRSITAKRYDLSGQLGFQSYPVSSLNTFLDSVAGTRTYFDAINRPKRVEQDSELGTLVSTTSYPNGFATATTNFRQQTTTNSYLAWDQPSTDLLVRSEQPEDKVVVLDRHPSLGHVRAITQRNSANTVSLTRRYVYDGAMQLCKVVEPETGATVSDYDAAGNLAWSAAGLALSDVADCNLVEAAASGRRVVRQYDGRNRVSSITFPDGLGNQAISYRPNGGVAAISTANEGQQATNSYTYNARNLLKQETLTTTGSAPQSIEYRYDQNGNLSGHVYPSGRSVGYAPNALGQATQAGSYATGVAYFPNGGMSGFTYGNGIVHSLVQNTRGLPDRSLDSYGGSRVLDDGYVYDPSGNVMSIVDGARGGRTSRDMTYDGLDRIRTATSPMFGQAAYTYDALDNLRTVKVGSRNHIYYYDGTWRLTNIRNSVSGAAVVGLGYDVQGNLTNKNGQAYRFDFGNRLREATGKETYRYDGHGRRVESVATADGAPIVSFYGQDGVLRAQRDHRVARTLDYIYLNGSQVARTTDVIAPWKPRVQSPSYSPQSAFTVEWPAVGGAASYEVQESANGGAWVALASGAATNTSVTRGAGSYQYRARACNTAGCGEWSASSATTVELVPAVAPTLSAPATATNGDYAVSWTGVAATTSYVLEESANGGAWTTAFSGAATSRTFAGRAAGAYAHRVKACNGAGCSAYSAIATVQAVYQPGGVTVTAPAASYTGSYTVTWTAGTNSATSYRLEESANGAAWVAQTVTGTAFTYSGKASGAFAYRVTACNAGGCGPTSTSVSVQVTLPPGSAPTLSAPASAAFGNYTVSWTSVGTATSYALEESAQGGAWVASYAGASTSNAYAGRPVGSYGYRVRACNAGGCGPYSASVTVQSEHPPATPNLTVPPTNYVGSYTISWTASPTSTSYRLEESVNGGAWTQIHNAATTSLAVSGRTNGTYSYRVVACNGVGCSAASAAGAVQVTLPPGSPSVAAPATSATGNYTLSWSGVATASSYQVEESQNGGAWTLLYDGSALSIGVGGRPQGSHQYRARACNIAGCGGYSAVVITAVSLPPPTPAWIASAAHLVYVGPVLQHGSCTVGWAVTPRAATYNVRITNGPLAYSGPDTTAMSGMGNNLCASSHQVQACNAGGCSDWSTPSQQQITEEHYPGGEVIP